jgi:hypothetical protein
MGSGSPQRSLNEFMRPVPPTFSPTGILSPPSGQLAGLGTRYPDARLGADAL